MIPHPPPNRPNNTPDTIIDSTPTNQEFINYAAAERISSLRTVAIVVYILQALSFFTIITGIVGLIISYIKRDEAKGTWVSSHFRWQIRTFWYFLLWALIGAILLYVVIGLGVLFIASVWAIYRIVKGALYAIEKKPMYY